MVRILTRAHFLLSFQRRYSCLVWFLDHIFTRAHFPVDGVLLRGPSVRSHIYQSLFSCRRVDRALRRGPSFRSHTYQNYSPCRPVDGVLRLLEHILIIRPHFPVDVLTAYSVQFQIAYLLSELIVLSTVLTAMLLPGPSCRSHTYYFPYPEDVMLTIRHDPWFSPQDRARFHVEVMFAAMFRAC